MYLVHQKIWEFKTLVLSLWVKQLYKCEKTNKQTNKQTDQQTKNYQKYFILKIWETKEKQGNKTLKNIDSISSLLPFHTHQIHTAAAGLSNFLTRHRMSDFNYC